MSTTNQLETLRRQYFDLTKTFLAALKDDRHSDELERLREEMKETLAEIKELESRNSKGYSE